MAENYNISNMVLPNGDNCNIIDDEAARVAHTHNLADVNTLTTLLTNIDAGFDQVTEGFDQVEAAIEDLYTNKAPAVHTHQAADITSGVLGIEKGGTNAATTTAALTNFGLTASSASNAPIKVSSLTIGNGVITYDSTKSALKITFN